MSSSTTSSSIKEGKVPEEGVEQVGLLDGVEDQYEGVVVEMKESSMEPKEFVPLLRASMSRWTQRGKKGVWIKLPITLSNLIDSVIKEGFRFHHAEPEYLMLVKWIPGGPGTIPVNATHRVGIGAFVMNKSGEVLLVQEKQGGFRGTGVWKLPTGVVNEGEDICAAAIREVKEETGIEAEFGEILAFRQSHKSFFTKSDLFFVCMLHPLTFDIQKQDSELEAAQWMSLQDYIDQPYNKDHQLFKYVAEICRTKSEGKYAGFSAVPTATASAKQTYLYLNNQDFSYADYL
ncbi:hypothetical protein Tsubulata_000524 [Turnera subulata]|uniref:Nudix hydrolase domain-containing protein n=1 Tax=Turnera subulata TaxID=218843 RepID=A0A9Q0JQ67_9ROSI|nr:hypothetical protein Tsubulata_000524 [Turnera subulata]